MSYDAKKAAYQEVTILGRPALFAECRIDNSTVPKGLYRYELRHGDENWGDPVSLSRNIIVNYYGAVLTREPFQLPIEGWIPLEDDSLSFQDGGCRTLAEFQRKYPVSKKDVIDFFVANDDSLHDFYFSHSEAQDKATGCVGHLRGDFGSGKQFFTTWWPHQGDQLNTPAFKADIDRAVNWLREQPDSPLHDFDTSSNRWTTMNLSIWRNQNMKKLKKKTMLRADKVKKCYWTAAGAAVLCLCCATHAMAASGDPLDIVNNLSDFIFSIIKALGVIILGWGIVQVGMSIQSHDASQRTQGFLCLFGGLMIAFAKEILSAIGAI